VRGQVGVGNDESAVRVVDSGPRGDSAAKIIPWSPVRQLGVAVVVERPTRNDRQSLGKSGKQSGIAVVFERPDAVHSEEPGQPLGLVSTHLLKSDDVGVEVGQNSSEVVKVGPSGAMNVPRDDANPRGDLVRFRHLHSLVGGGRVRTSIVVTSWAKGRARRSKENHGSFDGQGGLDHGWIVRSRSSRCRVVRSRGGHGRHRRRDRRRRCGGRH